MNDFEMKKKARYDSFVEVIEYYAYLVTEEGVELNDEQRRQLQDAADRISCFGTNDDYNGIGWANVAYDILGEEPVSEFDDDEEEPITESKKSLMEDVFDDILAAHPEWNPMNDFDDLNSKKNDEFDDKEGEGYKIEPPYQFFSKSGESMTADKIYPFHNDFAIAEMNGLKSFIDKEGNMICDEWFKSANDFECGLGLVRRRSGLCNFVKEDGEFLLNSDVDRASDFVNGKAMVINGGRRYEIDTNGNEI